MKTYIVSAVRTPIGSFGGVFKNTPATKLGAIAIKAALEKAKVDPLAVDEVYMGNVLQANLGQAPARQAAIFAGISANTPATTINKVCASGMKAISLAVQSIKCGDNDIVIAGGMENMSMVPFYSDSNRFGNKLGNSMLIDGLIKDGLTDVYNNYHMGIAAELCAETNNITREDQDNHAIESYKKSAKAWENKLFDSEIAPVVIPQRKGDDLVVTTDEEFTNTTLSKIPNLRPVFKKDGTITAANASTINDGAAALVIASEEAVKKYNLTPIAEVLSYADAAMEPELFTIAPSKALPKALKKANKSITDIDLFEINEAFSVVSIANTKEMKINPEKVNVNGGAVSLGHPLGCSGARITVTLIHALINHNKEFGAAAICNGGGGASALVIRKMKL